MEFKRGDLVHLIAGGVDVFRILEMDVDGDTERALVEAVGEPRPGIYPIPALIRYLVPANTATKSGEDASL